MTALLFSHLTILADSSGKCGDKVRWTLSDDGTLVISGEGEMKNFNSDGTPWLPTFVKQLEIREGVTHIGSNAFKGTKIFTVTLPVSVTSIGKKAFSGCKNLSTVSLPYGITTIEEGAFSGCPGLVKLDLPASLTTIGKSAFDGCKLLQSIYLSNRLTVVGEKAFAGCNSINNILCLPDIITSINAKKYGLAPGVVAAYYEAHTSETSTSSLASNISNASPIPASSVKKETPNITAGISYGESDVDKRIVVKPQNNINTFVLIIANENYSAFPDVPFAINDGLSFKTYCTKVLGIPERNITMSQNATLGNMFQMLDYIKNIDGAYKGDLSVIVYYAGHGAPDEKTQQAYIIPSDAFAINEKTCLPLDYFYKELGSLGAGSVKVFMDACFSGTGRTDEMLAQGGRSVRLKPKNGGLSGNVVVVSATSSDQTAWHYKDQGHGLFTYCLLKKLQETDGEVSMGELCDYLESEIPKISIVVNRITQTPTSQHSPSLGNGWRLWPVKK